MSCHTTDGYRAMKRLLAGRNPEAIASLLDMLHRNEKTSPYHAYMPTLVGTDDEISALASYLTTLDSATSATQAASADPLPTSERSAAR